ncbi:MAG: dihydrolipoamide acetyltransferase family protein, partial [Planctomycetota bacterium]
MPQEFILPDLGEGITEAQIVRLLISEGDTVTEDQALMEVETDKAAVEIPSPYAGIAQRIHVQEGQTVKVGDVMVSFAEAGAAGAEVSKEERPAWAAAQVPAMAGTAAPRVPATPRPKTDRAGTVAAAPAVRKLARELGVDLTTVPGSGPNGRVQRSDVERAASGETAQPPATPLEVPMESPPSTLLPARPDSDKWGGVRRAPLTQIRKTIAKQMSLSVSRVPHVTHTDDADITELEHLRRGYKATPGQPERKLTLMPFIIKAVTQGLRRFPEFNASFDETAGEIIYKQYVSIGIAVDTERGLIVPVLRDADRKAIPGISDALVVLAEKVRKTQFAIDDLRGGTFTITNVGAVGGRYSTPI